MNLRVALPHEAELFYHLDHSRPFSAHWSLADWQAELAQPAARVWGAFVEEQLVGFLCVRGAVDQYEITNLAVAPTHSRQGIASTLLTQAAQALSGQLTLEVSARNVPAQGLYHKHGFTQLGVRKQFYADGSDALLLRKQL